MTSSPSAGSHRKWTTKRRTSTFGFCVAFLLALASSQAHAKPWTSWVDDDDDDGDGVADLRDASLDPAALQQAADERLELSGTLFEVPSGGRIRLFHGASAVSGSTHRLRPGDPASVLLQGITVGQAAFRVDRELQEVNVLRAYRVARGKWKAPLFARISRERPGGWGPGGDEEAFAVGVRAPKGALPKEVWLRSYSSSRRELDLRGPLTLARKPCPTAEADTECGVSDTLRLVSTRVDRAHPSAGIALRVELGGRVELSLGEQADPRSARQELHVVGPSSDGRPRRGEIRLRVHVLRQGVGGSPAVGGSDEGARRVVQRELRDAAALWGQCGLELEVEQLDVVDPPKAALLSVGCEQGAASAGGSLALNLGKRRLEVTWPPGLGPRHVAERIREAIKGLGFTVELSDNGPTGYTDLPTVDLTVRDKQGGRPVELSAVMEGTRERPISSDAGLPICIGEVALRDGLDHFNDFNASGGTLEERSLIKALQDDDPATIELFVVPSFANSGRIGESFIYSAGASLRNVLIVDRAGIRAGSRSYVLAHELGHVLLDMPGHPDDFGVDDPGRLMDSDASESSIFGPRRLSADDCRRVWSQSGEKAPLPLVKAKSTGLPKTIVTESP